MATPEPSRIAILVSSLNAGGAERVALNLAEDFDACGYAVDLVVINLEGPLIDQVPPSVRIIDLGVKRARHAVVAFRRYLKTRPPAAVISMAFQANLLALLASTGLRPKPVLMVTVHNAISRSFSGLDRIKRFVWIVGTRMLYPRADAIVAVSEGVAGDLVSLGLDPRRVTTIHNPIFRSDFDRAVGGEAEHPWFRNREIPVIVTVGRLTEQKDHRLLISAFQRLQCKVEARLLIIGEGKLRPDLERYISELDLSSRVMLPGHIENPYPYMREADVFVLSSAWEGFGNVLVEAMATGTPVISTDCPHGPREILEDGKWGELVPAGDAEGLAEAMAKVISDGGVDASARARDFTVAAAAGKYLALLGTDQRRHAERA